MQYLWLSMYIYIYIIQFIFVWQHILLQFLPCEWYVFCLRCGHMAYTWFQKRLHHGYATYSVACGLLSFCERTFWWRFELRPAVSAQLRIQCMCFESQREKGNYRNNHCQVYFASNSELCGTQIISTLRSGPFTHWLLWKTKWNNR